jgi:hypothetical protein
MILLAIIPFNLAFLICDICPNDVMEELTIVGVDEYQIIFGVCEV